MTYIAVIRASREWNTSCSRIPLQVELIVFICMAVYSDKGLVACSWRALRRPASSCSSRRGSSTASSGSSSSIPAAAPLVHPQGIVSARSGERSARAHIRVDVFLLTSLSSKVDVALFERPTG